MYRIILLCLLMLHAARPIVAQEDGKLLLDELIRTALEQNPQLHAARHQAEAAKAVTVAARSFDPPQIGIEFYQVPISSFPIVTKENMETDYYAQQMFPWPGKRALMGAFAENNANMKTEESRALDNKIIRDLKTAYYELYLIQRKKEFNVENRRIIQNVIELASRQYEVGFGSQSDILRAQTELTKLVNEGISLERDRRTTEAMINTLVGRPANSPLGIVPEPVVDEYDYSFERLVSLAEENRPELKAMDFNIRMFQSERDLAKRELYPDIMVRAMYKDMTNTTKDFWSVMVGVSIPMAPWSRNRFQGKADEAAQHIRHAGMDYQNMKNMIGNDIQNALVKLESSRLQAKEIKEKLIPQAETSLNASVASFQGGNTSFMMVLDACRMLLMAKLDHAMNVMDAAVSANELEQSVGLTLDEIKSRSNK